MAYMRHMPPTKVMLFISIVLCFSLTTFLVWGASALTFLTSVSSIDTSAGQRAIELLHIFGFGYYILPIVTIGALEIVIHGYRKSSLENLFKNQNGSQRDILFLLIFILISKSQTAESLVTFGLSSLDARLDALASKLMGSWNLRLRDITAPVPALLFLSSIIYDLAMYVQHRIAHEVKVLWAVHRVHHSAEEMTLLNWGRDTIFGNFFQGLIIVIPLAVISEMGIPKDGSLGLGDLVGIALFIMFNLFTNFNRFMSHSNLQSNWGWFGRHIVVSPAAHRVHHSVLEKHFDKNYGSNLIIWDRIFGTYYNPEWDVEICPIGLKDNPYNSGSFIYNYSFRPIFDVLAETKKLLSRLVASVTKN
jgi:sterol desaturase/sphingolipid hydroxylase (fatty acid hydroxylase superfamily)